MTVSEKIFYLEKVYNLDDRGFSKRFKIKLPLLKKILYKEKSTEEKDVKFLCKELELDPEDFVDIDSVLIPDQLIKGSHLCKRITKVSTSMISEDFPMEDNSRYEEKD